MNSLYGIILTFCSHSIRLISGFILLKLIALHLGPEGLGNLGHFMSMVAIVFMLAGGGIVNGVTKYVAEFRGCSRRLLELISAASFYAAGFSLALLLVGVLFSSYISTLVFDDPNYYWVIILLSIAQVGFSFSAIVTGVINGFKDLKKYAQLQIAGGLTSLPIIYFLTSTGKVSASALAIIILYFAYIIPALYFYINSNFCRRPSFYKTIFSDFKKFWFFTLMLLSSSIAFPIVEILLREYLIRYSGYTDAGLWQASIRLSGAYVGFFAVFLGAYFMPIIASENDKKIIRKKVFSFIAILAIIFIFGAAIFYFLREILISFLLSESFLFLSDYIIYQLLGDFFKVLSYVIGYVAVAKAATRVYIFAEFLQGLMFISFALLFSSATSPLLGIFGGYVITYFIYFLLSLSMFLWWSRRGNSDNVIGGGL